MTKLYGNKKLDTVAPALECINCLKSRVLKVDPDTKAVMSSKCMRVVADGCTVVLGSYTTAKKT